jgi:hypothetical protein
MIVSPSRGFIFVHIPKTGGTSITHVLEPYRRWQEKWLIGRVFRRITGGYSFYANTHAPLVAARDRLGERFHSMLKFAVVRHPVDWNLSMFRWVLKWRGRRLTAPIYSDSFGIDTFEDYLHWRIRHGVFPQMTQLVDYDGNLLVDLVCRLESLESDLAIVLNRLGIVGDIPKLNVNSDWFHKPTEKEIDLISKHFVDDFKAFGYSKDGVLAD